MDAPAAAKRLCQQIPSADGSHTWCWHIANTKQVATTPFVRRLTDALSVIDETIPGYAAEMIARAAGVTGVGTSQHEALLQICSEI